jgi:3-deoxy-D-manno-octulosonic-acid transferase
LTLLLRAALRQQEYREKIYCLGLIFYTIFLMLFKAGVRIASIFNIKARKWVEGRKGIWVRLGSEIRGQSGRTLERSPEGVVERSENELSRIIWMHCASLGEFEQGRPILERIKAEHSGNKVLLTFFSPSGFEIRKDYKDADWVFYLPMDGPENAKRFLQIVNPSLVIFVKYEFWYYYLKSIKQNNIPLLLVSALFRENSGFFKWYGVLQRKMLSFFTHLFVQNESSKKLLDSIGLANNCTVTGDTRFDRVIEIAENGKAIEEIEKFIGNSKSIIAGSTWPEDEEILKQTADAINDSTLKVIIAPHEINKEHISHLLKLFPGSILFSELKDSKPKPPTGNLLTGREGGEPVTSNILIIDNIGILSLLYKYAYITYIGGGFGKGIHNTLEAAVYGKPVLFGPAYQKFNEAVELIQAGGAFSISNTQDCITIIQKLSQSEKEYLKSCNSAKEYVYTNKGATEKILNFIQENRLLTN